MTVLCLEQIPIDPQSSDPSQSDKQDVLCLCFSPSEETLMASTSKNQLYTITMSLTEISKVSPLPVHVDRISCKAQYGSRAHHSYEQREKAERAEALTAIGVGRGCATLMLPITFKSHMSCQELCLEE